MVVVLLLLLLLLSVLSVLLKVGHDELCSDFLAALPHCPPGVSFCSVTPREAAASGRTLWWALWWALWWWRTKTVVVAVVAAVVVVAVAAAVEPP